MTGYHSDPIIRAFTKHLSDLREEQKDVIRVAAKALEDDEDGVYCWCVDDILPGLQSSIDSSIRALTKRKQDLS